MKKGKTSIGLAVAFFMVFSAFLALAPERTCAKETYNWRLQSVWLTPVTQDGLKLFAENVKKATNGRVNIKVYQANQLVKIKATRGAVKSGAIEMACDTGAYVARVIPEANVEFGLPFSWRTWDEALEAWTKYGIQEKIREAYAEKGLYYLALQPASGYILMTTKPVRTVDALQGMKVRTWGLTAKIFKALGAAPTMIPGAEQYVALQRGTVDGTIYPVFVLDAYKLKEVIKYVHLPGIITPPTTSIYVNLKLWNSVPPDLQKAISETATQHQTTLLENYLKQDYSAIGRLVMNGLVEVITLPESEVQKIRKIAFAEWDKLGAKSPRCKELVDAMKKFMADKGIR